MTPKQLIHHFEDENKAAAALGKSVTCIRAWLKSNRIPLWSQHAIAHICGDKLVVDVRRKKT